MPDWEVRYRQKIDEMMMTLVGTKHRTVYWLGPPTLQDHTIDKGARELGPVMRQEAAKFAPYVTYVDTYHLFSGEEGGYAASLPNAHHDLVQMRISDGVHFTVDGAQYLAQAVWKLLNRHWHINAQAHPSTPIEYKIAPGSNDYVPGVGHYRPSVSHSRSQSSSTSVPTPAASTPVALRALDDGRVDQAHDAADTASREHATDAAGAGHDTTDVTADVATEAATEDTDDLSPTWSGPEDLS